MNRQKQQDGAALAPVVGSALWVAVAENMPAKGQRVLVACKNGIHVWRTIAQWYPAGTMDASDWDDPPEDWWDEAGDRCTCPEDGWWESCVEAEGSWMLSGVSHWMPLPALPNIASQTAAPKTET